MTPELLAATAAILLSLLFSYVPGFKTWYEPLPADMKRLVMLALLFLTAAASLLLACAPLATQASAVVPVTCDTNGALGLLKVFVAAMIANQSTYALSPRR